MKKESLLVYDTFKAHLMDPIKKKLRDHNTVVAIIPGGLTSQLQPLDVSLNKPFKEKVRVMWPEWIAGDEQKEFTKVIKPSITLWCNWILKAWEQIDPAIVVKSCCISNNLDGTEDDILFEDESDSDTDPFADIGESDDECV